jgi:hypothetical protein
MESDSLRVKDHVERLFPAGHPLHPLVVPTFHTVRRALAGLTLSGVWIDADLDPTRAGFRPSYDGLHGVGASTMMPFITSWMSTGAGSEAEGNTCLFPVGMDPSLVAWARRVGLLGDYAWICDLADIRRAVLASGRRLYSIDDPGPAFDDISVVSSRLSTFMNTKDTLAELTAYMPVEILRDMHEAGLEDYHAIARPGHRVFLKTCNTETAGRGVEICENEADFLRHLETLRRKQAAFGLSRSLVIQREILGTNHSFNVLIDPGRPEEIQVLAITNQLVEADGKTYRGSQNFPPTAARLERVGPVILDMVRRVWARFPEAFGFLMCDYFETPEGEIVVFDPGLRPSGNTASAMVFLLARLLSGRTMFVESFPWDTGRPGFPFEGVVERLGSLGDPENLAREDRAVLPWGWNVALGRGILIGAATEEGGYREMVASLNPPT